MVYLDFSNYRFMELSFDEILDEIESRVSYFHRELRELAVNGNDIGVSGTFEAYKKSLKEMTKLYEDIISTYSERYYCSYFDRDLSIEKRVFTYLGVLIPRVFKLGIYDVVTDADGKIKPECVGDREVRGYFLSDSDCCYLSHNDYISSMDGVLRSIDNLLSSSANPDFKMTFEENTVVCKCKDCGKLFTICKDEVEFYESKGWELPKRCKTCRDERKKASTSGYMSSMFIR